MGSLALHCADYRLALQPQRGACMAGFWLGDDAILRSSDAAQAGSPRESGGYALVPYSNRIAQARFRWLDREHTLEKNFAPEPHAIHGVAWQRAWEVDAADEARAVLSYTHAADAAWPFAFRCTQSFRLDAQGLAVQLRITNLAAHAVPVGLGWHPYFVKRSGSRLHFKAASRWAMGADKLPVAPAPSEGLDQACGTLSADHCFSGWQGPVRLADDVLDVTLTASTQHLVVFTDPTRDFIAIEPVSHVNNALCMARTAAERHALGLRVLQAGESTEAAMHIRAGRHGAAHPRS